MQKIPFSLICLALCVSTAAQTPELPLTKGMKITMSCQIKPGTYVLPADSTAAIPVCTIEGENLEVDFRNAELRGAAEGVMPDRFYGYAIIVRGKNIRLKNVRAQGYKVALYAEGVEDLQLENCDFSYNYRARISPGTLSGEESAQLNPHLNGREEWLASGAGIYLKNCRQAVVRGCRITGNQNALLMNTCNDGVVYNNIFQFNSGIGIGLYGSSRNKLMHNLLDWNVRSTNILGQDSDGVLITQESNENVVAYNSITHSGNGLFLWSNNHHLLDGGPIGSNQNIIFGNDFSYAPATGIRMAFSRNRIQGNIIRECHTGIFSEHSSRSKILGNYLASCQTGVLIEHGKGDTIRQNLFQDDSTGIQLLAQDIRPGEGYVRERDRRSRDHSIDRNVFLNVRKPLKISNSQHVSINGENLFYVFDTLLETKQPNDSLYFLRNDIYGTADKIASVWNHSELSNSRGLNFGHTGKPDNPYAPLDIPYGELHEPDSLKGGMVAVLPDGFPRGRRFILVNEWGPFDFRRPIATVDTVAGPQYSLALIGPSGDWKITDMKGVKNVSVRKGKVPAQVSFQRDPAAKEVEIQFEYSSLRTVVTQFGKKIPPGETYRFTFRE